MKNDDMSDKPMLRFYREHKVSPVRQDLTDLKRHFERRSFLYLHLGIPMSAINGRTVLEIGPGSGHNAFFTATLKPSRYLLVEGNPTAVEHIQALFAPYPDLKRAIEVRLMMLEEFAATSNELFDYVLCEAALSGFQDPAKMLPVLSKFVAPGGVLVVTTMDAVSCFAELVRRFCAYQIMKADCSVEEQVDWLLPALLPHLTTLTGMSRRPHDWIIDNILLPVTGGYNFLSLADVADKTPEDMDLYYTSPRFLTDWRWYKDISRENREFRHHAEREYWRNVHGLLSHGEVFTPRDEEENRRLYALCLALRDQIVHFEETKSKEIVPEVIETLSGVAAIVSAYSPLSKNAIDGAINLLKRKSFSREDLAHCAPLASFFGRTMQYVSVCKRAAFDFPDSSV